MTSLDEGTRRYYLDIMGVQCWQALDTHLDATVVTASTGEVIAAPVEAAAQVQKEVEETSSDLPEGDSLNWPALDNNIQQCSHCLLHQTRTQAVTGSGNQSAPLMIIMLSAGMDAGASGLLTKMLAAINIAIEDIYITSLLKCDLPAQHTVSMSEIKACSDFLNQQIQLVQPKQLFVLGETATRCLFQKNIDLDGLRDQINTEVNAVGTGQAGLTSPLLAGELPLLVSYSPQELLQQPENKRKSWSDLQQLQALMQTWMQA